MLWVSGRYAPRGLADALTKSKGTLKTYEARAFREVMYSLGPKSTDSNFVPRPWRYTAHRQPN